MSYPAIRPSLLLDFANTRRLDPRITFTRASSATFYDGSTTAKAEENLLIQSQAFDTANWSRTNVTVTADQTAAPDGTSTADLLAETITNGLHLLFGESITNRPAVISGQTYAFSVFLKKGTGATAPDIIQVSWGGAGFATNAYVNFNINTGVVSTAGAGAVTSTISAAGNGWYRCSFTATATSTSTSSTTVFFVENNGSATRAPSYAGATTADVFVWGAQMEQRSAVTDYIATTTQAITNYVPVLQTAAEGVARFDHNPVTRESLGLLVEEQRANLLVRSEEFQTTWFVSSASITTNTSVSPAGTLTADKLVENTANAQHVVSQTLTLTANQVYTLSVFVKAAERTRILLSTAFGANWATSILTSFDLSSGTVVSGTGTITNVGNGWYRCSITATFGPSNASGGLNIILINTGTTTVYTGDGYSGVYLWGAQLEAGGFATSYIPTAGSSVTRNADAASMTGTNFSSWYQANEGTVFLRSRSLGLAYNGTALALSDGTINNRMIIRGINTSNNATFIGSGANGWAITRVGQTTNPTSFGFAYKTNDILASRDAETPVTDTAANIPAVDRLIIGADGDSSFRYNGTINKIAFYPIKVTSTQLQALTA
jgi:hypothetical protein